MAIAQASDLQQTQWCPSVEALEYELVFLVRRLEAVRRQFDFGLERAHYLLLLLLEKNECRAIGNLAQQVNLDASTVTRQISAMKKAGLVTKYSNPDDRRGGCVAITDKGKQIMEEARQRRLSCIEALFSDWSEEQRACFAKSVSLFNGKISDTLNELV